METTASPPSQTVPQSPNRKEPPKLSKKTNGNVYLLLILALLTLVAIYIIFEVVLDTSADKEQKDKEASIPFAASNGAPHIDDGNEPPKTITPAPAQPAQNTGFDQTISSIIDADKMRKRAEEQERLKRWASPQLLHDRKSSNPQSRALVSNQPNNSSLNAGDSNADFASQQFAAALPASVQAGQLANLDSLITQGTVIKGILESAITTTLPGQIRAIVSNDVYSFNKESLLIPTGSHLIGEYKSDVRQGQARVFVIWNRLIRPDGVTIQISSFGTDALGRGGLEGDVNTHFWERFGSSLLFTFIDAGIQLGTASINNQNNSNIALDGGNDLSRSSEIALENSINIRPTIDIDQGTVINVMLSRDLDFSALENSRYE